MLALVCIWIGTGWLDGFHRPDTQWLGRKFAALAPWAIAIACVAGPLIRWSYGFTTRGTLSPVGLLVAIPRAFAVFPLYGFIILLGLLLCGLVALSLWGLSRVLRLVGATGLAHALRPRAGLFEWIALPIWMIVFPFTLAKPEGELPLAQMESLHRRMLWLLPVLLAFIVFWTGAVSEDTGDRVDPFWLAAGAAYGLSDFRIVARQVIPRLHARARRDTAPEPADAFAPGD